MKKIMYMLVILILFITVTKTNSKYITTINLNKNFEIAKPIFMVEKDEKIHFTNENINNTVEEYNFCIKNYSNENISDVDFEYIIEINNQIDMEFLEYELYEINNGEEKMVNIENNTSPKFQIYSNKKEEQEYKLKFYITDNLNEKEINKNFNIKIIASQLI